MGHPRGLGSTVHRRHRFVSSFQFLESDLEAGSLAGRHSVIRTPPGLETFGLECFFGTPLAPLLAMARRSRPDPRGVPAEYHDEYSETLGAEFRKLQDALLSDTVSILPTREPIRLPQTASVAEALEAML